MQRLSKPGSGHTWVSNLVSQRINTVKIANSIIILIMAVCLFVWIRHTDNPAVLFDANLPAGQRFYLISKLSALLALASLILQISFMLFSRYAPARWIAGWSFRTHQWLGMCTFVLIFVHSASFVAAASFRGGSMAWALLLPNFHSGLYNAAVSLGLIAFYSSMVLVLLGFFARGKKNKFNKAHRWLVWPILLFVLIHSIAIGSESKTLEMIVIYGLALGVLAYLIYKKQHRKKANS